MIGGGTTILGNTHLSKLFFQSLKKISTKGKWTSSCDLWFRCGFQLKKVGWLRLYSAWNGDFRPSEKLNFEKRNFEKKITSLVADYSLLLYTMMILVLGPLRGLTMRVEGVGLFPATLYLKSCQWGYWWPKSIFMTICLKLAARERNKSEISAML